LRRDGSPDRQQRSELVILEQDLLFEPVHDRDCGEGESRDTERGDPEEDEDLGKAVQLSKDAVQENPEEGQERDRQQDRKPLQAPECHDALPRLKAGLGGGYAACAGSASTPPRDAETCDMVLKGRT
jgi:hypothetical protein